MICFSERIEQELEASRLKMIDMKTHLEIKSTTIANLQEKLDEMFEERDDLSSALSNLNGGSNLNLNVLLEF